MEDDELEVRGTNESFYAALCSLDLERMGTVWLQEDWVRCIHPGGDLVEGWLAVEASWAQIFEARSWLRVVATSIEVTLAGELAIVACHENITTGEGGDIRLSVAVATNLYRRTSLGWRMIHHHASSAPVTVTQAFTGTVQ